MELKMMTFKEYLKYRTNEKFVLSEETKNKIYENERIRSQQIEKYGQKRKFHKKLINEIKSSQSDKP